MRRKLLFHNDQIGLFVGLSKDNLRKSNFNGAVGNCNDFSLSIVIPTYCRSN